MRRKKTAAEQDGAVRYAFLSARDCSGEDCSGLYAPGEKRSLAPGTDKHLFLGIARRNGRVVALVRCSRGNRNRNKKDFRIRGLHTRPDCRNRGIGTALLRHAVREMFTHLDAEAVYSFILPDNHASIRVHEQAGFRRVVPPFPPPGRLACYAVSRNRFSTGT